MSYHDEDDEKIMSGYDLPPIARGHLFLSPDQEQQREADGNTPTRVLSCHSLAGEDFILSARPSLDFPGDIAISPFTPSEGTQTPPMGLPDLMTPPPLHPLPTLPSPTSPLNIVAGSKPHPGSLATTSSSLPGRMRPPRVPHVSLQPTRVINARHGRGLSYSDYSFLSALTDGTNDMTPSVSSNLSIPRRRTVSWDYNDAEDRGNQTTDNSVRSTPAALLQPVLKEEFGAPLASIVTNTGQKVSSFSLSRQPRTQRTKDDNGISSSSIGMRSTKRHPTIHAADAKTESSRRGAVWNPSTAQDTGSFIHILDQSLDPQTPPSTRRAVSPGAQQRHGSSEGPFKKYSIADVLDSYPPEPPEETLFIGRIESQKISWNHNSLTTDLPAETLIQYISNSNNEIPHDVKHPESSAASPQIRRSADSSFEGITKKLLDASPNQRKYSSGTAIVPEHRRQPTDLPKNAGEKMHEATEVLFGGYSDSIFDAGNDEEMPTPRHPQSANQEANDVASTTWAPWHPFMAFRKKTRADLAYFAEFLGPQRPSLQKEFLRLARLIMLPSLGIATILFYLFPNPPTGYNHPENENVDAETIIGPKGNENPASYSWLILFYGVRQMITLELARFSQLIIIDFFTIRTKIFPKALGPTLALMVVQAKGWPFILTFWALWDFALLYGYNRFANHWMYWQTWINMFNETNPHGNTTSGDMYGRVLILACVLGITISVKRAVVGQIVGKRVVRNYRGDMARLMQKLIILNDVSHLSMKLDAEAQGPASVRQKGIDDRRTQEWGLAVDVDLLAGSGTQGDSFDYSDGFSAYSRAETKKFTGTAQIEMLELLEEWEEPELQGRDEEPITVGTILQFRRAWNFISDDYPFSPAFGSVRTREDCVQSAQMVFERLMAGVPNHSLSFDVLCLIAKDSKGNVDRNTVRELIRVFRPNRNGQLSKLDFVKSVDSVFKSLRLLLASIQNSQQIDRAYEAIVNIGFCVCAAFIVMATLGVDIQALVIGAGSIIVSFAFMIGPTSSNYLEGILFVLARKPYDIGDLVNIDDVTAQSNIFGGESSWIIEKVDLFTTTARLGATRELATFSNGSLSTMRIKNLNRSDKPNVFLNLKFSLDSTQQQRQMFKKRLTAFVKERPREWIKMVDFRSTRVEADLGFVEYVIILQHREKWQNLGAILTSRGDVFNFAVELQKVLHMKYKAPHVPIDIRRVETESSGRSHNDSCEIDFLDESKKER